MLFCNNTWYKTGSLEDYAKVFLCFTFDAFSCFFAITFDITQVHLKIAPATETLQKLVDNNEAGTFDFAFIDADKVNNDHHDD